MQEERSDQLLTTQLPKLRSALRAPGRAGWEHQLTPRARSSRGLPQSVHRATPMDVLLPQPRSRAGDSSGALCCPVPSSCLAQTSLPAPCCSPSAGENDGGAEQRCALRALELQAELCRTHVRGKGASSEGRACREPGNANQRWEPAPPWACAVPNASHPG